MRIFLFALLICAGTASARDLDGRYAQTNPQTRDWIRGLTNKQGVNCCDAADGTRLEDVDWEASDNGYRVRIDGDWIEVPPEAVIDEPNRLGPAMVWRGWINGKPFVRCFLPGAGA